MQFKKVLIFEFEVYLYFEFLKFVLFSSFNLKLKLQKSTIINRKLYIFYWLKIYLFISFNFFYK